MWIPLCAKPLMTRSPEMSGRGNAALGMRNLTMLRTMAVCATLLSVPFASAAQNQAPVPASSAATSALGSSDARPAGVDLSGTLDLGFATRSFAPGDAVVLAAEPVAQSEFDFNWSRDTLSGQLMIRGSKSF